LRDFGEDRCNADYTWLGCCRTRLRLGSINYSCVRICIHTYIVQAFIHAYIHTRMHSNIQTYEQSHKNTYKCTDDTYAWLQTHINTSGLSANSLRRKAESSSTLSHVYIIAYFSTALSTCHPHSRQHVLHTSWFWLRINQETSKYSCISWYIYTKYINHPCVWLRSIIVVTHSFKSSAMQPLHSRCTFYSTHLALPSPIQPCSLVCETTFVWNFSAPDKRRCFSPELPRVTRFQLWSMRIHSLTCGRVFLERTQILSGVQLTRYFIESVVTETKRFVGSNAHSAILRPALENVCRKQMPSACIYFSRSDLVYVLRFKM